LPSLTAAAAVSGFAAPPAAAVEPSSSAAVASVAAAVAVAAVAAVTAVADVHTGLIAPFAVAPVAPVALDLVAFPDPYLEGEALPEPEPEPEPGPFSQDYHMDWLLLEASSDAQA